MSNITWAELSAAITEFNNGNQDLDIMATLDSAEDTLVVDRNDSTKIDPIATESYRRYKRTPNAPRMVVWDNIQPIQAIGAFNRVLTFHCPVTQQPAYKGKKCPDADWTDVSPDRIVFAAWLSMTKKLPIKDADTVSQLLSMPNLRGKWLDLYTQFRNISPATYAKAEAELYEPGPLQTGPGSYKTAHNTGSGVYPVLELTGQEWGVLGNALARAFPTTESLRQMLVFHMNENLESIAGGSNLSDIIFNLIRWASSRDRLYELIHYARQANPGNSVLRQCAAEFNVL